MYFRLAIIILTAWAILISPAMGNNTIRGTITDGDSNAPIPYVEVFISGTTVGCISDKYGNYELKVPFLPCTLVADHVSYDSFITVIQNCNNTLNISLSKSNISIGEVKVSSKNKRKRNLRYFYSRFLKEKKSKIEILNDSVLVFDRTDMDFKASSKEPLIIINKILGYKIKLILNEFSVFSVDGPNGKRIPLNSIKGGDIIQLVGYYYYEPLSSASSAVENRYIYNRRLTYYGSIRHFLKAVYDNNLEDQGFNVESFPGKINSPFIEIEKGFQTKTLRIEADSLQVFYFYDDKKFPVSKEDISGRHYFYRRESRIYTGDEPFVLRSNGTSPRLSFVVNGLMTVKNFAYSLPEDYSPPLNKESR